MSATPRKKPPAVGVVGGGGGGQNIQVFVRCRPLNSSEKAARSYSVVDTPNSREISVKEKQASSLTKTFQFDRVFGINSKQMEVYRSVVEPLIGQVMQGYNCTVFAYGQTGTGKTFTMEGGEGRDEPGTTWENDPTAGIVPRALAQLFDELRLMQDAEFSVRVSYLELYNEEIFDLLSAADDTTRLRLYEDSTKKGSVIIQGLEEVQVHNKREVYEILEKGSVKRKTAETLMNAHSSRSHTVFTVTVHLKESSVDGEEVLRIGKLNLVDLAGSENIGRSGAQDKRAREAGNINQSLLTLGRVITCLVERAPHIPYRESKLTRLLQDSLGGRTKTSIIATVSPAGINLEETLSTLDYAHRAKNIQNKPEINQKLSKKAVLKEYTEEIERLRKDLMASREKNGIYLANENYQSILAEIESQAQEIAEKIGQIKAMKDEMEKHEEMFDECSRELQKTTAELENTHSLLKDTEHTLNCTKAVLHKTANEREEQKHLVEKHVETELKLSQQAKKLLTVSDQTSGDLKLLHDKLDRTKKVEKTNEEVKDEFLQKFTGSISEMLNNLETFQTQHGDSCSEFKETLKSQFEEKRGTLEKVRNLVVEMEKVQGVSDTKVLQMIDEQLAGEQAWVKSHGETVSGMVEKNKELISVFDQNQISPQLDLISQELTSKSKILLDLEKSVLSDFSKMVETFNKFTLQVSENIVRMSEDVREYSKESSRALESVLEENRIIQESEKSFKSLLENLMFKYTEHSEKVSACSSRLENSSKSCIQSGDKLVADMNQKCEESSVARTQFETLTATQRENLVENVNSQKVKCETLNQSIETRTRSIAGNVSSFCIETKSMLEKLDETSSQQIQQRKQDTGSYAARFRDEMNYSTEQMNRFQKETIGSIKVLQDQDSSNLSKLSGTVLELSGLSEKSCSELGQQTQGQEEKIRIFLQESLERDVPTGSTPARTERVYPRYLAATSPHDRIIQRYRTAAENASVAARLPLEEMDEEDDDDSVVSVSTVNSDTRGQISRQNSTCSNSSSSRRNLSREPSGDLKPRFEKKVKSESGCFSGSEDTENKDPFTKPSSKPKLRREIPKPEIRTRKHLSTSN